VHNHPSGDPTPSSADVDMIRQVVDAGGSLGIAVHDHLVVGRDGVASLKALGLGRRRYSREPRSSQGKTATAPASAAGRTQAASPRLETAIAATMQPPRKPARR